MNTRLRLLIFVLAVPLLAALSSSAARDRWDERWRAGLGREFRAFGHRAGPAVMARYSLETICADPRRAAAVPPCRVYNRLTTLIVAGAATSGLGVLWLGVMAAAGAAAARRRRFAARAFRPLTYASAVVLVVLAAAQGLLAVQALSLSGRLLLPGVVPAAFGRFAGLAAALLVGLLAAQAARSIKRLSAVPYAFARVLGAGEGSKLRASVSRLCEPGGPPEDLELAVGLAPAVFVVPGPTDSLDGRRTGPLLHFPLSLARILTVPECEALLAAQLFRLRDGEARSLGRFTGGWLRLRDEAGRQHSAPALWRTALLPVAWWLTFLADAFAPAATAAWRDEEEGGDRTAIATGGAEAYLVALLKVHAFAPAWDAALQAMADAVSQGEQYASAPALFASIVTANAEPSRVEWALGGLAAPNGEVRGGLSRWGSADLQRVAAAALDVQPEVAATTLVGDVAVRLEADLTDARHALLQ
ncbi:MAG TPA: hypothetical protein PKK95_06115 [Vicinamibacterales bacterium]|nr:hypothetical protein [Acidobacteriota bacterium]HOC17820.1 hypothetical protein [Vicinamibacterales bacterium]